MSKGYQNIGDKLEKNRAERQEVQEAKEQQLKLFNHLFAKATEYSPASDISTAGTCFIHSVKRTHSRSDYIDGDEGPDEAIDDVRVVIGTNMETAQPLIHVESTVCIPWFTRSNHRLGLPKVVLHPESLAGREFVYGRGIPEFRLEQFTITLTDNGLKLTTGGPCGQFEYGFLKNEQGKRGVYVGGRAGGNIVLEDNVADDLERQLLDALLDFTLTILGDNMRFFQLPSLATGIRGRIMNNMLANIECVGQGMRNNITAGTGTETNGDREVVTVNIMRQVRNQLGALQKLSQQFNID